MPEVNANVTKSIKSIILNTETKVTWDENGDACSSTTPQEITLSLSDLSVATQEELQSKL